MKRLHSSLLPALMVAAFTLACSDDGPSAETETGSESGTDTSTSTGDGDGDPAGDGDGDPTGDGDGDPTGDGDGDPTGDGDGDPTGDGDGDPTGDGDGDMTGDGDGDMTGDGDGDMTGDGDGDMTGDGDGDIPDGMVGNGEFWIDAHEVSVEDYALYLPQVEFGEVPEVCSWKNDEEDLVPNNWNSQISGSFDNPVGGVDWCDAWLYCDAQGKHLCGQIGGQPATIADKDDTDNNEWMKACTDGDPDNTYPYGDNYDANACNTGDSNLDDAADVGSFDSCEGGFAGLFDMSGNAWEWTTACAEENVQDQQQDCRRRGGSYTSSANNSRCTTGSTRERNYRNGNTGFRCCMNN